MWCIGLVIHHTSRKKGGNPLSEVNFIVKRRERHNETIIVDMERAVGAKWSDKRRREFYRKTKDERRKAREERRQKMSEEQKAATIQKSIKRSKSKTVSIMRSNQWGWFLTFGVRPEAVKDRTDYNEHIRLVQKTFERVRKRLGCPFLYMYVPEPHPTTDAWHGHGLLEASDGLKFSPDWVREKGTGFPKLDENGNRIQARDKRGRLVYNWDDWGTYNDDGTVSGNGRCKATIVEHSEKSERYCLKYITKGNEIPPGRKRYLASRGADKTTTERYLLTDEAKAEAWQFLTESKEVISAKTTSIISGEYQNRVRTVILQPAQ